MRYISTLGGLDIGLLAFSSVIYKYFRKDRGENENRKEEIIIRNGMFVTFTTFICQFTLKETLKFLPTRELITNPEKKTIWDFSSSLLFCVFF